MKSGTHRTGARLAALLLGIAMLPATAWDRKAMSFKDFDTNKNGSLSLDEFRAKGKDDLAFKAADTDGDRRVDPGEFDQYLARKESEHPKSGY